MIYNSSLSSIKKNRTQSLNGHLMLPTTHEALHSFYTYFISACVPTTRPVVPREKHKRILRKKQPCNVCKLFDPHGPQFPNTFKGKEERLPSKHAEQSETTWKMPVVSAHTRCSLNKQHYPPFPLLPHLTGPSLLSAFYCLPKIQIKYCCSTKASWVIAYNNLSLPWYLFAISPSYLFIFIHSLVFRPSLCHLMILCFVLFVCT